MRAFDCGCKVKRKQWVLCFDKDPDELKMQCILHLKLFVKLIF